MITIAILSGILFQSYQSNNHLFVRTNYPQKTALYIHPSSKYIAGCNCGAIDSTLTDSLGIAKLNVQGISSGWYAITDSHGKSLYRNKTFYLFDKSDQIIDAREKVPVFDGENAHFSSLQWTVDSIHKSGKLINDNHFHSLNPDSFRILINNTKNNVIEYLNDLSKRHSLPEIVNDFLMMRIHYNYIDAFWNYLPQLNARYDFNWPGFKRENIFSQMIDEYMLNDKMRPYLTHDLSRLKGYLDYLFEVKTAHLPDSLKWLNLSDRIDFVQNTLKGQERHMAYLALSKSFSFHLEEDSFFDVLGRIRQDLESNHSEKPYLCCFENLCKEYEKLRPGNIAPTFSFPDSNGCIHSNDDFIGKMAYVTFWGTWCGPCIQNIPKYIELQKEFKKEAVKFIYVAVENADKLDRWKNFLKDNNFTGTHLFAESQFNNEYIKPFLLRHAPAYVLIDKNGRLISARAQGPERIRKELINQLRSGKK